MIRNQLGISDSVRLKLNGTFERELYLLDENNCMYSVKYSIQTALWLNDKTGKWQYVSIFPDFIKRYVKPCLHLLEYISCHLRKGENIYRYIDDPKEIIDCEDRLIKPLNRIEKDCLKYNYSGLLNSKYTDIYNRPLVISNKESIIQMQFDVMYLLVLTARLFFGKHNGVISFANEKLLI